MPKPPPKRTWRTPTPTRRYRRSNRAPANANTVTAPDATTTKAFDATKAGTHGEETRRADDARRAQRYTSGIFRTRRRTTTSTWTTPTTASASETLHPESPATAHPR